MSLHALWYRRQPLMWLLAPLAGLYAGISALRHWLYAQGWLKVYRAPVPVIVVGNITVGGNGKTPVVVWLVEQLRAQGWHPGVISRGYGGKAEHYPLAVTAATPAAACGDEPRLIVLRCGCPLAVAPRRAEAVRCLLAQDPQVDVIIADDGLQHYALARDIELVVVDGERRFGNGCRLPMGPLRESTRRLRHVDAVICNGGVPRPGEYVMTLLPEPLRPVARQSAQSVPEPGAEVDALAGIGHPPRFFTTLQQAGFTLREAVAFADHQSYDAASLQSRFVTRPLLMTEKDAVKCHDFARDNWWYLPVSAQLPAELLNRILAKLKDVTDGARS